MFEERIVDKIIIMVKLGFRGMFWAIKLGMVSENGVGIISGK